MPLCNLVECSDNYSKTSRSLWQCFRDEPALDNNGNIADFADNTTTNLFKFKETTGETGKDGTKNVEIMVSLKYLSNCWRIF